MEEEEEKEEGSGRGIHDESAEITLNTVLIIRVERDGGGRRRRESMQSQAYRLQALWKRIRSSLDRAAGAARWERRERPSQREQRIRISIVAPPCHTVNHTSLRRIDTIGVAPPADCTFRRARGP